MVSFTSKEVHCPCISNTERSELCVSVYARYLIDKNIFRIPNAFNAILQIIKIYFSCRPSHPRRPSQTADFGAGLVRCRPSHSEGRMQLWTDGAAEYHSLGPIFSGRKFRIKRGSYVLVVYAHYPGTGNIHSSIVLLMVLRVVSQVL